jgi:hypothetical protein
MLLLTNRACDNNSHQLCRLLNNLVRLLTGGRTRDRHGGVNLSLVPQSKDKATDPEISSWLSQALPRYSPSSSSPDSRRRSKNPRWRSPSPMSASVIPPPIVDSIYSPSSPQFTANIPVQTDDSLLLFRRKQRQLEAHLQRLLDAQADALLSGLETSTGEDDDLSTGSSTPTTSALHSKPRPSTKSEKIGLRHARVGLYATIRRLAQLKTQESQYLTPNLDHFTSVVTQLDTWERKCNGLESRASQIRSGEDHKRALDLHKQADEKQEEINQLENRLAHLKSHQRKLRAQAQEMDNTVDARLTSYTTSLALVEDAIQNFLRDDSLRTAVINIADMDRFWHLPIQSRTLDAAKKTFGQERDSLLDKRRQNDAEREALEEGAVVWKDTVKQVSAFERTLTKAMSQPQSDPPLETKELLSMLEQTTTELEAKHKLAESRNWKLLVCAIGAELEALLKGKQILETALASVGGDPSPDETKDSSNGSGHLEGAQTPKGSNHDDSEAIRDLDKAFTAKRQTYNASDTDTEDEGPGAELLVSQHDTDTE